jgi:PmbA protein
MSGAAIGSAANLLDVAAEGVALAKTLGADEAEICVARTELDSVALQKSDVHAATSEDETTAGVRVLVKGAPGFASTNDPSRIRDAIIEAVAAARCAPPDPTGGFADPAPIVPLDGLFDPALREVSFDALVEVADEMLERVRALDPRVRVDSGGVSVERVARAVANSRGVRAKEERALAEGRLFGMAVDGDDVGSFDAEGDVARNAADLRTALRAAADRFVLKTTGALQARKGESFKGSIVLSPEAVAEFVLGDLASVLSAKAVRLKKSPFAGKVGAVVADGALTLLDAAGDPTRASAAAFDREGSPTRPLPLIERGVLRGFLYDAYEARAAKAAPSGHARGGPAASPQIAPWAPTLAPGDVPFATLCAEPDRCVLVSRFSGSTNPVTGEFSGVVKGGFLLKKGERVPLKEVQIAGNLYDLLLDLDGVSRETRLIDGVVSTPALRFGGVSVTAG